jgi:exodeoxyribonuclease VII small subunit
MHEFGSFEEALTRLEESVTRLDEGELKMEEALKVFEQGIAASRACAGWLEQARQRAQVLVGDQESGFRLGFLDEAEGEEPAE